MEEEPEPRALAAAGLAHAIHAVVPVAAAEERQAVRADRDAAIDRADAVLEDGPRLARHVRQGIDLVHVGRQRRRLEERHRLVEHARIACRPDVLGDDVGQPEQIVGTARPESASARLVPPVLDVALDELARGRAQDLRASEVGPRQRQRQHVLQLIAKPEGAAGLVVAAARPQPAGHRLIEQPSVHQEIERVIGRADLDGLQNRLPRALRRRQRGLGRAPVRGGCRTAHARPSRRAPGRAPARSVASARAPGRSRHAARRTDRDRHRNRLPAPRSPAPPAGHSDPLRPMNAVRSAVADCSATLEPGKRARAFRTRRCRASARRSLPCPRRTRSRRAWRDRPAVGRVPSRYRRTGSAAAASARVFVSVNRENLTGSLGWTNTSSS